MSPGDMLVTLTVDQLRALVRDEVRAVVFAKTDEEALTRAQAAKLLGIHPRSVSRLVRRGTLRGKRVGRVWRFRRRDVDACMAATEKS